jgi:hypothetical protein
MKFKYLIVCLLIVSLFSCKKGDSYDVSKITTFATFEYDPLVVIPVGTPYTPEVVAKEGDNTITATITGSSDVNTVGVYNYTFSATNAEGYEGTALQTLVVYDPTLTGTDVSGNINDIGRPERTGVISLVEGTSNIFYCTDMGFGGVFPVYFQMIGDVMEVIPQPFIFGVEEVQGTYDPINRTFSVLILPQGFAYNFEYSN